jgi:molybdate transport system substrate-binding protein
LPIPGIDYVGPLPAEVQRITTYWAGVTADARSPAAARALIDFFVSPEGKQAMTAGGLEPIDAR